MGFACHTLYFPKIQGHSIAYLSQCRLIPPRRKLKYQQLPSSDPSSLTRGVDGSHTPQTSFLTHHCSQTEARNPMILGNAL